MMQQAPNKDMQTCINDCHQCASACQSALRHCFMQEGKSEALNDPKLFMDLMDCVDLCTTAVRVMQRQSPLHTDVCSLCADVCRNCAETCRNTEDMELEACAELCDNCAQSCEAMSGGINRVSMQKAQNARPFNTTQDTRHGTQPIM